MTTHKIDIVNDVAEATGMTKKDANLAVEAVITSITDSLAKGNDVTLTGFGHFVIRDRAARKGRNPQTGEEIEIAATKVPAFKPGKSLKEVVK